MCAQGRGGPSTHRLCIAVCLPDTDPVLFVCLPNCTLWYAASTIPQEMHAPFRLLPPLSPPSPAGTRKVGVRDEARAARRAARLKERAAAAAVATTVSLELLSTPPSASSPPAAVPSPRPETADSVDTTSAAAGSAPVSTPAPADDAAETPGTKLGRHVIYPLLEVLADLLDFAARALVPGGRLCYWLPTTVHYRPVCGWSGYMCGLLCVRVGYEQRLARVRRRAAAREGRVR